MENFNFLTPLEVIELGCNGRTDLIPAAINKNSLIPQHSLPFGLPPVLSTLQSQLEHIICSPEELPIHDFGKCQRYWPRTPKIETLFSIDPSALATDLIVERDFSTGKLKGFSESEVTLRGTAQNSVSMCRLPGPPSESVRGNVSNLFFLPGGMDEPIFEKLLIDVEDVNFETDLLSVPPGFSEGMNFDNNLVPEVEVAKDDKNIVDLWSAGDEFVFLKEDEATEKSAPSFQDNEMLLTPAKQEDPKVAELENEVIMKEIPVVNITNTKSLTQKSTEWAEIVDVTKVDNFHELIPNMAYTWEFDLDPFQQHAILHLEQQDYVFVAAHTSAGKTVVAEYAIALANRNKTKTIYTSPIKALSNQKYRDFKIKFGDVGILTGDVQLNEKAACLIMTTEILRSMLYRGSDTLRDVEWVIFDEVHYINDHERGVVWEEVLIMLPEQVNIIMLSATVPNELEFAHWVGKTKKRKVYVIRTMVRPVPLVHYLYTGSGGKSKDENFLIVNSKTKFEMKGYKEALAAMAVHQAKMSGGRAGPSNKFAMRLNPKQEETMWNGLISFLDKSKLLPVICFIFSRDRCDQNALRLRSIDNLTTSKEKWIIKTKFDKWIQQLKDSDKNLPQVKRMRSLLENGIGVHHSGILPILKEIVEMMFQDGFVKVLFATETFAIGVNMPARTVIFDTVVKHDGKGLRNLEASEYIQMAGRAGRRGEDKEGAVIILCKKNVPDEADMRNMMMGKPTRLASKFRLTYAMILKLFSRKHFKVEDIIKRSFLEIIDSDEQESFKRQLEKLHNIRQSAQQLTCSVCSVDLAKFCIESREIVDLKNNLHEYILNCARKGDSSIIHVGRVLVVSTSIRGCCLGLVVKISPYARENPFKVLILTEKDAPIAENEENMICELNKMKYLVDDKLFIPESLLGHSLIDIDYKSVITITTISLKKLEGEKIIADWNKRQQIRFKSDSPIEACHSSTRELLRLSEENAFNEDLLDAYKVNDIDHVEVLDKLKPKLKTIDKFQCINCPHFEIHLKQEMHNVNVDQQIQKLEFQLSDDALKSIPDYKARLEVLKELKYVKTSDDLIDFKGKVACWISNHELMVTELLLDDDLMSKKGPEIAALLSCLVCQQKGKKDEDDLYENLREGRSKVIEIAKRIEDLQKKHGVQDQESLRDYVEQFDFCLANVVYEWASARPFSEICEMTDVQEGIIVRTIQRLDEILKDLKKVAHVIGNPNLEHKMEEVSNLIRRDIVFAASLYTQDINEPNKNS
uniref:Helicase SKI2W n=1 Tax=Strigamia maritima TaxID=126957 RepID=T1IQX5_STRMM